MKKILTIKTNPEFAYILNDLTKNFTRFELREYVALDGKYSKMIYQHLRQYRKTGWWNITVEDIRRELAIPDSYANKYIMDKVIKPSIEVLKSCKGFSDLTVEQLAQVMVAQHKHQYRFFERFSKRVFGETRKEEQEVRRINYG